MSPSSLKRFNTLANIDPSRWQRDLSPANFPFADYPFLQALEQSGVLSGDMDWLPWYLALDDGEGLAGGSVLYEKSHSYGEYIFDWAWANAYAQHGLAYYPKLVSCVPFTPATGPKVLGAGRGSELIEAAKALAVERQASSAHYLFLSPTEIPLFESLGLMIRHSFQFHWHNFDYASFDDFLGDLKSRKRKQILKERREIRSDIRFHTLRGEELNDGVASRFTPFYLRTIEKMGAIAYLNADFFSRVFATMGDNIVLMVAERDGEWIAASLFFVKGDTLFGRYWGATEPWANLHFEMCYYRGIEFAIAEKLKTFEAGAQGEHKLARGFLPSLTFSAHWIRHPQFADAIGGFIESEKAAIREAFECLRPQSPFRDGSTAV